MYLAQHSAGHDPVHCEDVVAMSEAKTILEMKEEQQQKMARPQGHVQAHLHGTDYQKNQIAGRRVTVANELRSGVGTFSPSSDWDGCTAHADGRGGGMFTMGLNSSTSPQT